MAILRTVPVSHALAFFGMGDTEILLIMVVVLIFFGGDRLPELARGLGKALRELRRATSDVEREFKRMVDDAEHTVADPLAQLKASALPQTPGPIPQPQPLPAVSKDIPKPSGKMIPAPPAPSAGEFHSDI